ncbi:MAG: hypothetical protein GVX96_01000 [Bacteroidetes bacterium]|jgi:hypothetical protein|nr:hypothetical protein [Bacteroidota bacterium]
MKRFHGVLFLLFLATLHCTPLSSQSLLIDFNDSNYVWGVLQGNSVQLADEQDILGYEMNELGNNNVQLAIANSIYTQGYIIYQVKRTTDNQILKTVAIPVINSSDEGERPGCRNGISHKCDGNCPSYLPETYCESCAFTRDECNNITGCKCNTQYGCCVHTITSNARSDMNLMDNIQDYEE